FQAEDGIRDGHVTGVQTCALPISSSLMGFATRRRGPSFLPEGELSSPRFLAHPSAPLGQIGEAGELPAVGGLRRQGRRRALDPEIGRASCRERVWIAVRAGAMK